jgi:hypothetical protein
MPLFVRKFGKMLKRKGYRKRSSKSSSKRCYKCGSKDHFIVDCPHNEDNDKSTKVKKRRRMTKKVKAWHSRRRRRRRRSDMQYVLSRIVMLRQVKKRETPPSL